MPLGNALGGAVDPFLGLVGTQGKATRLRAGGDASLDRLAPLRHLFGVGALPVPGCVEGDR